MRVWLSRYSGLPPSMRPVMGALVISQLVHELFARRDGEKFYIDFNTLQHCQRLLHDDVMKGWENAVRIVTCPTPFIYVHLMCVGSPSSPPFEVPGLVATPPLANAWSPTALSTPPPATCPLDCPHTPIRWLLVFIFVFSFPFAFTELLGYMVIPATMFICLGLYGLLLSAQELVGARTPTASSPSRSLCTPPSSPARSMHPW